MNLRAMPARALAPSRATQAGQVSRGGARLKGLRGPPGWGLGVELITQPYKKPNWLRKPEAMRNRVTVGAARRPTAP